VIKSRPVHLTLAGRAPLVLGREMLPETRGDIVIDLSGLEFVSPLDIAGLASYVAASPIQRQIRLTPPTSPMVANYLLRMELPAAFDGRVLVDPPFEPEWERDETPALIELTRLRTAADLEPLITRVWARVGAQLPAATCVNVFKIVGELVDNAVTHGQSEAGTYLAAQYYSGKTSGMPEGFWIGVADAGIGIRAHLSKNPRHRGLDDARAIQAAARPRVTGTKDAHRGWGLVSVRQAAGEEAPGWVSIVSGRGEGRFFVGPDGTRTAHYWTRMRPIRGTWALALAGGKLRDGVERGSS